MRNCKVCSDKTKNIFNISFEPTAICESCATSIFLQQAQWYAKQEIDLKTSKKINHNV